MSFCFEVPLMASGEDKRDMDCRPPWSTCGTHQSKALCDLLKPNLVFSVRARRVDPQLRVELHRCNY